MGFKEISRDLPFTRQLKEAIALNPAIAERKDKPNLSAEEIQSLASLLPDKGLEGITVKWSKTEIKRGHPYWGRAEDQLFEMHFGQRLAGKQRWYYFKGFFFDKQKLVGVYLISAREVDAGFHF